jgi:hypothetical protein
VYAEKKAITRTLPAERKATAWTLPAFLLPPASVDCWIQGNHHPSGIYEPYNSSSIIFIYFTSHNMSAITISENGAYDVHRGFWINWSSGRIRGATFTTTRESGGLLIAFIALYVSISGRSFWRLSCFFMHRWFSSYVPADALHHQRQVILRNADTAGQAMITLLYAFKWRKKAPRTFRRIGAVLVYAVIVWAAFTASGK